MQTAAISVASTANTRESWEKNKLDRTSPYWTVAYGDVLYAVSREINERERAEKAEERIRELETPGQSNRDPFNEAAERGREGK